MKEAGREGKEAKEHSILSTSLAFSLMAAEVLQHNYITEFVPSQGRKTGLSYSFRSAPQFSNQNKTHRHFWLLVGLIRVVPEPQQ